MGMAAILNPRIKTFSYFSFRQCLDATYDIWLHLAQWLQRRSRLKCGGTTESSHPINSPGAFGSGKLKTVKIQMQSAEGLTSLILCLSKAALLFLFYGDFRCGVPLFIAFLVL